MNYEVIKNVKKKLFFIIMLVMIPVLSSTVMASTIADDEIIIGCTIGDDQLTAPCIGDDELNILWGIKCHAYTGEIFILHDNMYLLGNKSWSISHVIENDIQFSSTNSVCNVTLTMPNGTVWNTFNFTNHTNGVNNVTINLNGTESGTWIANYSCKYSYFCEIHNETHTFTNTLKDGFYVTPYGAIIGYLDTKTFEVISSEFGLMLGIIFLFIGIAYIYNGYATRNRDLLKQNQNPLDLDGWRGGK